MTSYRVLVIFLVVFTSDRFSAHEMQFSTSVRSTQNSESSSLQTNTSIENIIRAHLRPEGPPVRDDLPLNHHHLRRLTALTIHDHVLSDFSVLQAANLASLRLYNCHIGDFNSVSLLRGLKELHLLNCEIKNISAIATLRGLTHLSLTDNHIVDISALSRCK